MRNTSRPIFIWLLFSTLAFWGCNSPQEPDSDAADASAPTDVTDAADSADTADPDDTVDPSDAALDLSGLYAPDRVLDVDIELEADAWNQLRFERRSMTRIFGSHCHEGLGESPFHYYPANVTVDDTPLGQVGLRTKGLLGSINPARPSLKVKMHEFDDDIFFEESKRFTFNNQNQDDSRMRTCLAYSLFAAAGVPASMCNFAHIKVNGRDMGIYANVEPIKKQMLARLFGDDSGNLYEGTASDIRAGGFMSRVEKKTNTTEDDWSDIYQLRDAIEAPQESFRNEIEAILDVDAFITFWAAESLIGHWDGFSGNRNNYFTYHNPVDGKFHFIPWGPDGTFAHVRGGFSGASENDPKSVMATSKLARKLWNEPDIRTRYQERMEQLIETVWRQEEILAEVDRMRALIEPSIMAHNRNGFLGNIESLRSYISSRAQEFEEEFQNGIPEFESEIDPEFGCMSPQGEVNAEIVTTWGTAGAQNPFDSGNGDMVGSLYNWDLDLPFTGATAGWSDGVEAGDMASIMAISTESFDEFIVGLVNMPHWLIQSDTTVPIDGQAVSGWFVRFIPDVGPQLLGFVGGTSIEFREAGTGEGDTIDATIRFEIWGGGGGNNYGTPAEPPEDLGQSGDEDGEDTP